MLIASSTFTLFRTVYFDYLLNRKDTRIYAREWILENIPKGSKILLFGDYTFLPPINKPEYQREYYKPPYYNVGNAVADDRAKPLSLFIDEGYEYFIVSSYETQNYFCKSTQIYYPKTYQSYRSFYDSFEKQVELIYQTNVNTLSHPGPIIEIYKVDL
jgi:hypothetical protein